MSEMIKEQETSNEQGNAGRRRLVRGAVALAPLVLTLRSGAAAASCTGAKALATVNGGGQISNITNLAVPIVPGTDKCVSIAQGDICQTTGGNVKISGGVPRGTVNSSGTSGNFTCGSGSSGQVAILSSTSAGSLVG